MVHVTGNVFGIQINKHVVHAIKLVTKHVIKLVGINKKEDHIDFLFLFILV